jgi:hypothetical protein
VAEFTAINLPPRGRSHLRVLAPLRSSSLASLPGRPNKALKPTRLWACLLRGPASAQNLAVHGFCNSSAARLSAGVRPPYEGTQAPDRRS